MLNHPKALEETTNKLAFFQRVTAEGLGDLIPPYWTNKEDIPDEAFPIVCRTILNSHSGRGIVIADSRDDLVDAPLFTKYIKKRDEYRIHLGCPFRPPWEESIIISVQQKRRRLDAENPDWRVRNHANGFIYARENVNPPECVIYAAKTVFNKCTELDFGAVDVIYNAKQDRAYVLEINSAPGLEGQTLQDYAEYFPKEN
jgi:glutathione synthase/RimK-type ligase-like ATP-grasp enzyme